MLFGAWLTWGLALARSAQNISTSFRDKHSTTLLLVVTVPVSCAQLLARKSAKSTGVYLIQPSCVDRMQRNMWRLPRSHGNLSHEFASCLFRLNIPKR